MCLPWHTLRARWSPTMAHQVCGVSLQGFRGSQGFKTWMWQHSAGQTWHSCQLLIRGHQGVCKAITCSCLAMLCFASNIAVLSWTYCWENFCKQVMEDPKQFATSCTSHPCSSNICHDLSTYHLLIIFQWCHKLFMPCC